MVTCGLAQKFINVRKKDGILVQAMQVRRERAVNRLSAVFSYSTEQGQNERSLFCVSICPGLVVFCLPFFLSLAERREIKIERETRARERHKRHTPRNYIG